MVRYPPCSALWEESLKTGSGTGSGSTISSGSEDSGVIIISGAEELSGREEELSVALDKIETFGKDAILVKTDSIGKIYNEKRMILVENAKENWRI